MSKFSPQNLVVGTLVNAAGAFVLTGVLAFILMPIADLVLQGTVLKFGSVGVLWIPVVYLVIGFLLYTLYPQNKA